MLEFKKENIKKIEFCGCENGGKIQIDFNDTYIMPSAQLFFDNDLMFGAFMHDLITKYNLDLVHEIRGLQLYTPKNN